MAVNIRKVEIIARLLLPTTETVQSSIETDITTKLSAALTAYQDATTEAVAAGATFVEGWVDHFPAREGEQGNGTGYFTAATKRELLEP